MPLLSVRFWFFKCNYDSRWTLGDLPFDFFKSLPLGPCRKLRDQITLWVDFERLHRVAKDRDSVIPTHHTNIF